jgi:hypothetical protein
MRTTSARCMSRSIKETTQAALGKTSPHSANALFNAEPIFTLS